MKIYQLADNFYFRAYVGGDGDGRTVSLRRGIVHLGTFYFNVTWARVWYSLQMAVDRVTIAAVKMLHTR